MILQALKEYYDRKANLDSDIAPEGFEKKEIPFLVVIAPDGKFVNLSDTREKHGRRLVGKTYLLPRSVTRSGPKSYEVTFLLWDHIGYLFQHPGTTNAKDVEKARKQHHAWLKALNDLPQDLRDDEGVAAVITFYKDGNLDAVRASPQWQECIQLPSCNITFQLSGDSMPVPCRSAVQSYVRASLSVLNNKENAKGPSESILLQCLVTGEYGPIARTHGRTPINKDTKSLVSFQKNSGYDSYGKKQGYNAPVSKTAEFAYTTALNTLLKTTTQRLTVGDSATVFWASKKTQFEDSVTHFFGDPPKDDPDSGTRAVSDLLESVRNGSYFVSDNDTRFYVLGLSPNSARISIRFWHAKTVPEMAACFAQHFVDIRMAHNPREREFLSLATLLRSIAAQGELENVPPHLAGDMMRAILEELPYPRTLLNGAIRRIRAEQAKKDRRTGKSLPNVSYERAALIKAVINRHTRFTNPSKEEELKVSLDETNNNTGYRLGRLFAVLEKIQSEANPGLNATIRDKFYGAASSTPVTVFGNLMRLKNHHLAKLENPGRRVNLEKLIANVMSEIDDFPPHLKMEDQGRFAIGYYHQMQDFYTTKKQQQQK